MAVMKVVILCGGRGTRLREETEYRPKPMVPIGNRPIVWHIMKLYAHYGFKDFILCLGYKGDYIRQYFQNYLWMTNDVTLSLRRGADVHFHTHAEEVDWNVTLADTGEETMTAGRLKRIEKYLDSDTFLFTYGDGVGNIDIAATIALHRASGKELTLTAVHPPGRFGEIGFADATTVHSFNEKPQVEEGWINGGFFVAARSILGRLEDADHVMFEQEPIQKIAREGHLQAYRHEGFWQPMDTYQEYLLLNKLWNEGKAPWKVW
jgi:glucose-1-phosphate cytidylyltransferase